MGVLIYLLINQFMFEVVKFLNPLKTDYVHTYDGKKFKLKAGATYDLSFDVASDVAYHVAQLVCQERNLPLFGAEFEAVKYGLLGMAPEDVPKDILDDDVEEYGTKRVEEDVPELTQSAPVNTAFTPAETRGRKPKAPVEANE